MPLSEPSARRQIHYRILDMTAYARDDGLYDVEAHLVDRKPFDFTRLGSSQPVSAGQSLHDLWVRLTLDDDFVVRAIEAASDVTPWVICREAESTLAAVLVGERIERGWSLTVKERLRGTASCTHLKEMLIPLATTAMQGIRALQHNGYGNVEEADAPPKIVDTCYALGRQREVVQRLWPQHYRPPGDISSS